MRTKKRVTKSRTTVHEAYQLLQRCCSKNTNGKQQTNKSTSGVFTPSGAVAQAVSARETASSETFVLNPDRFRARARTRPQRHDFSAKSRYNLSVHVVDAVSKVDIELVVYIGKKQLG